ncbi:MAG: 50S ribosomal protein L18 [Synergistaceae bacterium]|nr:50S ribosomal protein L18 [Synergistaceae bacterium]
MKNKSRNDLRVIRHQRLRRTLYGTAERPRLCVFRSLKNIYVQVIDDDKGHTLASASTLDKSLQPELKGHCNVEAAKVIGKAIAERAIAKGITSVVFDRGGHAYIGKVMALAAAAREGGLVF